MSVFWWILISTLLMSLISWVGLLVLYANSHVLKKIILWLVAFSAGTLIGGAFLHMIPEAIEEMESLEAVFIWVLVGFSTFFLLEQVLHWHHCHELECDHSKPVANLILVADSVHNFVGGLVIAGAFLIDIRLGILTWIISAAHEIPQEMGDFAILIHSGWNKFRALVANFLSASTVIVGGLVAYFLSDSIELAFLLPFAAGNFIYIASSDLIPEFKNHEKVSIGLGYFGIFILGIVLIWGVGLLEGLSA
jgi:zinc and cadmium transporter